MRDYSSQANKYRQKAPKRSNATLGLILCIILSGSAATGLIWLNQSSELEMVESQNPPHGPKVVTTPIEAVNVDEKAIKPIAENIPTATENFYTFYDLLLQNEVPIDIRAGETRDEAIAKKLKTRLIQVASFRSAEAAESTRVKLLFLDLKARVINPSETNGGWYRIVLGPFKTIRDMNAAMDLLAKNGHRPQRVRE